MSFLPSGSRCFRAGTELPLAGRSRGSKPAPAAATTTACSTSAAPGRNFRREQRRFSAMLQCIREAPLQAGRRSRVEHEAGAQFLRCRHSLLRPAARPAQFRAGNDAWLSDGMPPRRKVAVALAKGWAAGMRRKVAAWSRAEISGSRHRPAGGCGEKSIRNRLKEVPVLRNALAAARFPSPNIRRCSTWCRRRWRRG